MSISINPSQRPILGGALTPVFIAGQDDSVDLDATLTVNGAPVSDANPMPVDDAGGSLTVDDGGGSLTVDQGAAGVASWLAAITSIAAGETHIGAVGGHIYTVTANPVLTVAGAYVANDYVGTTNVAMTFTNVVRVAGGSGVIESAVLVDQALQSASMELWLLDALPAGLPADNAPISITDADALTVIAIIPFQTYYATALNSVSVARGLGITFNAVARDIYGFLVTRGTPTFASLDVLVRLQILGD